MAGIPVRSGNADLTASGTPVRKAVQVQWLRALSVAVLDRLLMLISGPRYPSLVVPLLGTSGEPLQSLAWMVSYFFLVQELILAFAATVLLLLVVTLAFLEWDLILSFDVIMLPLLSVPLFLLV